MPATPPLLFGRELRVCRFSLDDEMPLTGFYLDDRLIPIDTAAERYAEFADVGLVIPATDDLLDLLPPDGPAYDSVLDLARWLGTEAPPSVVEELALPFDEACLLTPIARPPKLLFLAGNYEDHITERGGQPIGRYESFPNVFMKPPTTTLLGPSDPIVLPACSPDHIDWETELGVVIGRTGKRLNEAEALDYVAGYTVVNDISDRHFQPNPQRAVRERDAFFDWLHGKWHDGSCPVGPAVLLAGPAVDPQSFQMRTYVSGELMQEASTAKMIYPVAAIVSFISQFVTLEPGDIIATGTPAGVGAARGRFLKPGDVVIAEVIEIGRLVNPVEAEE